MIEKDPKAAREEWESFLLEKVGLRGPLLELGVQGGWATTRRGVL